MRRPKGYVTRQAKRLSDGEINRRRFVMSALSVGVTMPTALSLASRAAAQTPKPGGHLRMALATREARVQALTLARANTLTEITGTGEVAGELAETIEPADDARRWNVTLRTDVEFQNGKSLTADDVIAALTAPDAALLLPRLTRLHATAPTRLAFEFDTPLPDLPRRLADPRLVVTRQDGSGSGGYRLDAIGPGGIVHLTRSANYWKPGRAHFERVSLVPLTDAGLRQTALMTGEIDYADGIDPLGVALLHHSPALHVSEYAAGRHLTLTSATNPALATALAQFAPSQTIIDRLLLGHGAPAGASGPGSYRVDRLNSNRPIALAAGNCRLSKDAATLLRDDARKAGINIHLSANDVPHDVLLDVRPIDRSDHNRAPGTHPLVQINELMAHATALTHAEPISPNPPNDGARLIERWWFA